MTTLSIAGECMSGLRRVADKVRQTDPAESVARDNESMQAPTCRGGTARYERHGRLRTVEGNAASDAQW